MTSQPPWLRPWLKGQARQVNRLRWIRKARTVAESEAPHTRVQALRYVLTDPELDTFSYELANPTELAEALTGITGLPAAEVTTLFDEARHDRVLADRIRRGSRWNFGVKRQPPIGRHLAAYAITRALQPATVAEIGVRFGLGSVVLLRALERNADDGHPGELVGVDIDPYAGTLVAPGTPGWRFVTGSSPDILTTALAERRIGFLISDSVPDERVTTAEVIAALQAASLPLVVMQSGWNLVLPDICDAAGIDWVRTVDRPVAHIGAGRQAFYARFDTPAQVADALQVVHRCTSLPD